MKLTNILLSATVAGAMAFAASKASAFPLKLTSLSGTFTVTSNYTAIASTNKATAIKKSFNLKNVMTVITNQVFLNSGTNPPTGSYVVYDPYLSKTYLTNSDGYYYNLSGIVYVDVYYIATTFNGNNGGGGSENDTCIAEFEAYGYGPDGLYYEVEMDESLGSIKVNYNGNTGIAKMTISGKGAYYGEYQNTDEGVASGKFTLTGTGTPEWEGPFSVYWED
jgi:hypothetical protein